MAPPSRTLSPIVPSPRPSSPSSSPLISSPLSRSTTPAPSLPLVHLADDLEDKERTVDEVVEPREVALGRLEPSVYAKLLPGWRDRVRLMAVKSLEKEMPYLQAIQTWRTPALDEYFVKSSLLGTHSFFMICVPMPFWFGHGDVGRGLLYVLAAGGYLTSVLKDLFCVPRPFSPPLVRLSVGNHALEYGFPSTHSTTTVSMALYFGELLWRHNPGHSILNTLVYLALTIITVSVVFGRLYTGMHSMVDITVGSIMGALCWLGYWLLEDIVETFTVTSGWLVTATMIPATLFLVFVHPAPAEDCPCFEDAVAFLSVVAGLVIGRNWCPTNFFESTVGAAFDSPLRNSVWGAAVLAKLLIGVLSIFTWRLVAKEVCHAILPPVFRFFSSFLLPRRHYLEATKYDAYKKTDGLHPIPQSSTFPLFTSSKDQTPPTRPRPRPLPPEAYLLPSAIAQSEQLRTLWKRHDGGDGVRRDADVLTKVFVYAGIGWIASIAMPWTFIKVGLSV
ncbi:phosphatidic acid phosphatase type 2/haloperoxidase [Leucosporidium creatinivorum]|uniref:Phosphatidic acid phosphatase type 2/haloperoxidase n=1 Tax=Leucosporidium creatinivorum TaxID=106004 RepID=A0A1Y2FTZ9_9BASI|nr:phosphatidic acid phosphatase type 2/haloperoxidase [Leucosporidium creatinivorum]